jgi:hypothetical protein
MATAIIMITYGVSWETFAFVELASRDWSVCTVVTDGHSELTAGKGFALRDRECDRPEKKEPIGENRRKSLAGLDSELVRMTGTVTRRSRT